LRRLAMIADAWLFFVLSARTSPAELAFMD